MVSFPSNPARGSAFGLLLLGFTSVGMWAYLNSIRRDAKYVTISGKGGKATVTKLSRRNVWFGSASIALFLFVGVGLLYLTLIFGSLAKFFATRAYTIDLFTFDHCRSLVSSPQARGALRNTLVIVLGARLWRRSSPLLSPGLDSGQIAFAAGRRLPGRPADHDSGRCAGCRNALGIHLHPDRSLRHHRDSGRGRDDQRTRPRLPHRFLSSVASEPGARRSGSHPRQLPG